MSGLFARQRIRAYLGWGTYFFAVALIFCTVAGVSFAETPQGASVLTADAPNLIRNPSFEVDENGDGRPDHWNIEWLWIQPPNRVALDSTVAIDGNISLRATVLETAVPQAWGGRAFQDIPVTGGHWYDFSGWIRMENWETQSPIAGTSFRGWWQFNDGTWTEDFPLTEELYDKDTNWRQFATRFRVPPNARTLRLAVWSNTGTGTIWFDDLALYDRGPSETVVGGDGQGSGMSAADDLRRSEPLHLNLGQKPVQIRAVWLDNETMETLGGRVGVASLMETLKNAGFNLVLPVAIHAGEALYWSDLAPLYPALAHWREDPLQVIIEEASIRGLEVHPLVTVFISGVGGEVGPIGRAHPDWIEVDKLGRSVSSYGGTWLSPAVAPVQAYLLDLLQEIVQGYDIDGLHLDYIRYEIGEGDSAYGYHPEARSAFQETYGVDPIEIQPGTELDFTWNQWREQQITRFVAEAAQRFRALKPELVMSAAVAVDLNAARRLRFQDWRTWLEAGYVDHLYPMAYSDRMDEVRHWLSSTQLIAARQTAGQALVVGGLGAYVLTPQQLVDQIQLTEREGLAGAALFATLHMGLNRYMAVRNQAFLEPAMVPHRQPAVAIKLLLETLRDRYQEAITSAGRVDEGARRVSEMIQLLARRASSLAEAVEAGRAVQPYEIELLVSLLRDANELVQGGAVSEALTQESRRELVEWLQMAESVALYWKARL